MDTDVDMHIGRLWVHGGGGHYSRQENMYMRMLKKYMPTFGGGSVLEIGPGTGKFADMMFNEYLINSYTILDLEKQIHDSMDFLESRDRECNYFVSQDYRTIYNTKFTLVVSNVCLPETPIDYREDLIDHLFLRCWGAFIIGGNDPEKRFVDWMKDKFLSTFKNVNFVPTGYCNTTCFIGFEAKNE
jgi:hypothetical protein